MKSSKPDLLKDAERLFKSTRNRSNLFSASTKQKVQKVAVRSSKDKLERVGSGVHQDPAAAR